jgi:hypothetical protein
MFGVYAYCCACCSCVVRECSSCWAVDSWALNPSTSLSFSLSLGLLSLAMGLLGLGVGSREAEDRALACTYTSIQDKEGRGQRQEGGGHYFP